MPLIIILLIQEFVYRTMNKISSLWFRNMGKKKVQMTLIYFVLYNTFYSLFQLNLYQYSGSIEVNIGNDKYVSFANVIKPSLKIAEYVPEFI